MRIKKLNVLLAVVVLLPVLSSCASRLDEGMLQGGLSSTRLTSGGSNRASLNAGEIKDALRSSWLSRVFSCASIPAPAYAGAARRLLQECSCGPQQPQHAELSSADNFLIASGSATAAVANTSGSGSDSVADQLLLMKIKVLPVPASKIQRQLAAGGTTSTQWTDTVLRNLTSTAAAQLGVPAGNVRVELTASLAAGLQLPAPTLQQQPAAAQAVADFLEAISSNGSPSVLVGVDMVRPAGDLMAPTTSSSNGSSSSNGEAVIAIGSISGLGDITQSLRIAAAMQQQCPELFMRGAAFTAADSACAALLAEEYLPALAGQDGGSAAATAAAAVAAAGNSTAGMPPGLSTNSTNSNSTTDSSRASFAARVVMPVAVNIKLSIAVRAGPGHDAESLDAAAHAWLASQDFQQLLQDQGLQTGRGTPARLVVMPQPSSGSSSGSGSKPADGAGAGGQTASGGGDTLSNEYHKESGWFIPWKSGHGSSSGSGSGSDNGAAPSPQAGLPEKAPGGTNRAASDDANSWVELSEQLDQGKNNDQSVAIIVGGLITATVLGAGAAVGVVAVVRRRRLRRDQQGTHGSRKSSDSANGSSRGSSSTERRARRRTRSSRGIGKRYFKYLPTNLTASNLAAVAPALLAGQDSSSSSSTAPLFVATASAVDCASMQPSGQPVQPQQQQQHASLVTARANWESAVRGASSNSSGLAAPPLRSSTPSPAQAIGGTAGALLSPPAAATAPGAAVAPWPAASAAVGGWDVSSQRTGCVLLMSAVSNSLQANSLQEQQQLPNQQQQQQLSVQQSWQGSDLQQRQSGSFSRLRLLLRWMPSAPIARGDATALLSLPGVAQRSLSSLGTAAGAVDAVSTHNLRSELCRDSVSSAAQWDWLRQSQAGGPEASPDSMSSSLSRRSGSSTTSSLHSSRSSSRNSNGSARLTTAAAAASDVETVSTSSAGRALGSADGGSCTICIADQPQQQHQQQGIESSSSGVTSSIYSGRLDDGSCAAASTATCSSSLASQQQLRQAWWQQQQQLPGNILNTACSNEAAVAGLATMQASFSAQSAASVLAPATAAAAAEVCGAAPHPSEWLGFRSVGAPDQAAAADAAGSFVLDSRLLEEAAAAAAAAAGIWDKAAAGPSPFQLHYDFSALHNQ